MRALRLALRALLALAALAAGVAVWAAWPERARFDPAPLLEAAQRYDVRILRDEFGVPHVYGRTDPDVAYGLAFAHAEDDFETLQAVLLASRGELARVRGRDAAASDYLVHLFGIPERVAARYATDLPPDVRALAEAYADGLNHYAALHPDAVWPGVVPFRGSDVVAGFAFRTPFFYGLQETLRELFEPERDEHVALSPTRDAFAVREGTPPPLGSNAFAVGPARSADGATRLLVNSHQPFTGPVAWYEVRLHSEEGWDMAGGVFPGSPVVLHGHNRDLGWANTTNAPDLVDVYRLEVDPDDPYRYRLDGEWRELERGEARIEVRLWGRLRWTVTRETLRSVHGPVVRNERGTFALRFAGMDEIRQLEQYYRLNRAQDFAAWREAMRLQALPSINYVYADREGNIAYFYNALLPVREEGWDWSGILPGDRSDLVWTRVWPFDAVPRVVNPPSGFVANANHTPFAATAGVGNPDPADFPASLGIETRMTNRGLRALEILGGDPSITAEEFRRAKFDKRYSPLSLERRLRDDLVAREWPDDPLLDEARRVLADWDLDTSRDDRGAALGVLALFPVVDAVMHDRPPPDPADSLAAAARLLQQTHGRLDPEWGEVNRLRRGGVDLPVGGAPDTLRAIYGEPDGDGELVARAGDGLFLFVTWEPDGRVHSESIHQFGSAVGDPDSPHYADQAPLYADERTKPVYLEPDELRRHLEREYRPGEGDGRTARAGAASPAAARAVAQSTSARGAEGAW